MEIPKTYDPSAVEEKIYKQWRDKGFFHSEPDEREPFTIVIPPPNVTGVLHMGHALNNTIQDILVRKARMEGFNACWVPGTDHASIATEAKVVAMLKEQGIDKRNLSRDEFLKYAWEWKEKYGGIILKQLEKLGASCDWDRTAFTMDPDYYQSVINVFVDLYDKGYIYKGVQMVNWDPKALTVVSDEEVVHKEVRSKLYYIKYPIEGTDEHLVIATTRPETMLGDTAVAIHPEDERFSKFHGKKAIVPLVNRNVPIIQDEYVDREFGTGALKITPAHDKNDHILGKKHNLATINIFEDNGTLNSNAQLFVGTDRFKARKLIIQELEEKGYLVKVEEINNSVGYSERTDAVIEPRLSQQWFCRMTEMAKPALEAVMADDVEFYPGKFKNVYRHWMENIRDWCISRQLWWGHRIPAYYTSDGNTIVARNENEAVEKAREATGNTNLNFSDLRQDDDVLDTWFSSWLWPEAVFNGILNPDNEEIKYYYPTQVLVTGPDIIFFWVARMIMAGFKYRAAEPFEEVYFTGIIRDKQGRKMSKQFGNSPDLLELIDNYGADAVRFGILISSPAGNDLLYDEKLVEQGRNFANKIWNAMRLVKGWEANGLVGKGDAEYQEKAIEWFENRLAQVLHELDDYFLEYRLSEALNSVYKLIWDSFCSAYLEMIKPGADEGIHKDTFEKTLGFFEALMNIAHPFMPFLTEDIWQVLRKRKENDYCTVATYPTAPKPDMQLLRDADMILNLVSYVRGYRSEMGMSPKEALPLFIKAQKPEIYKEWFPIISKLANIEDLQFTDEAKEDSKSFVLKSDEIFIPQTQDIDVEAEKEKVLEELNYTKGFLKSVVGKLSNERFVQNANPEIVAKEQQKKDDAEARIKVLEETLERLS